MNLFLIAAAIIAAFQSGLVCSKNISATGGGVVRPGSDLVLKYEVDHRWERCYWYWFKEERSYEFCSFDMDLQSNGSATLHGCNPSNTTKKIAYSGTTINECSITVTNVTDDDNCTWAARLEDEFLPTNINVTVASEIENVAVTMLTQPIQADQSAEVACNVTGGRPMPKIFFEIGGQNSSITIFEGSLVQTPNEAGIYESSHVVMIRPKISDHGQRIECRAAIFDAESNPIYNWTSARNATLNVTFPPQSIKNQTVIGYLENNVTLSAAFISNPAPDKLRDECYKTFLWTVIRPESKKANRSVIATILPGHSDKKYHFPKFRTETETRFRVELIVMNLTKNDSSHEYHLEAINVLGTGLYHFSVDALPANLTTTTTSTTIATSTTTVMPPPPMASKGLIIGIATFVGSVFLGIVGVLVYKKYKKNNETYPMTTIAQ